MSDLRRVSGVVHALRTLRGPLPFTPAEPSATIEYAPRVGGRPRQADLYLPAQPRGASAVLVHGGGFAIGSRRMKPMRALATALVGQGVAVWSVDYRRFPRVRLPEMVGDVGRSLAAWRARAPDEGCDPAAITVIGASAGATLALLAAARDPGPLRAMVGFFGLYDWARRDGPMGRVLGAALVPRGGAGDWSPTHALARPEPLLLVHGTADRVVPIEHAHALLTARRRAGLPVELLALDGAEHGFLSEPSDPAVSHAIARAVALARG